MLFLINEYTIQYAEETTLWKIKQMEFLGNLNSVFCEL